MAQRTSSSDGSGFRSISAAPTSIIPGVQNPHCRPCSSLNAAWIGCSSPFVLSPSTVVIERPSACTASIVHDFIGVPSSSTVHAPQLVVSQPMWVPVSPTMRRMRSTRSTRGSTSSVWVVPLMVTVTSMAAPLSSAWRSSGLRDGGAPAPGAVKVRTTWRFHSAVPRTSSRGSAAAAAASPAAANSSSLGAWPTSSASAAVDLGVDRVDRGEGDAGPADGAVVAELELGGDRRPWRSRRPCARA